MMMWRPIPSLPEYLACHDGSVMRIPYSAKGPMERGIRVYGGKPRKGSLIEGRPTITFKGKNYRVSRLICEAFHGPAPSGKAVVMHLNDNPTDNRASNLKWGTQKENLNTETFKEYCRGRTGENSPYRKGMARKRVFEAAAAIRTLATEERP